MAQFQSTLPSWGATLVLMPSRTMVSVFQSTLPSRGATIMAGSAKNPSHISIHAPLTGSDARGGGKSWAVRQFQSTLPSRGATVAGGLESVYNDISIHAPLTGSDLDCRLDIYPGGVDFNPRSPHGERQKSYQYRQTRSGFQSTLPSRGATWSATGHFIKKRNFNPRSPHGERP